MKKGLIVIIISIVVMILGVVAVKMLNPLRKPTEEIRKYILELTPIGSTIDEVINIIKKNEKIIWDGYVNRLYGYPVDASGKNLVGVQSISASFGSYTNFYERTIVIFWGFDPNGKLIDIQVRKDVAGL